MIDFKLFGGFSNWQTDGRTDELTDIGGCRVAFATEKCLNYDIVQIRLQTPPSLLDSIIKYDSANTSLLEDDPTANQAEFCVHIRSWAK